MWVSKNIARKSHDVTLISSRGSSGKVKELPSNLHIIETIKPSWEGMAAEEAHYLRYKEVLEKEYGSGKGIVWDNTWHCFSYLSAKKFPKMKIIHTNHGTVERQKVPVKQLRYPRYIGLSSLHAKYMSSILKKPDIYVRDLSYVQMIREKCQNSNGLAEYIGLVDNKTKAELIKKCKAVIACPKPTWIEAFGLYAVEANAYGKPVLARANG